MTEHIDRHYEEELKGLKEMILKMGGIVEGMIARSVKALVDRNPSLADEVIRQDAEVNTLEMAIDDRCLKMLALRQPAASDLRFITIGFRISRDLERIGDLVVNVSEQAIELAAEPQLKPYVDLPKMATQVEKMVKNALNAFVKTDVLLAKKVCEVDDEVDELHQTIFDELVNIMKNDPSAVGRGTRLILVSLHLERVADHATNIAEEVIFMVQGRDIRHGRGNKGNY